MNSLEFIQKVKSGEIDVVEHTESVLEKIKKLNDEYHFFNNISDSLARAQALAVKKNPKGKLAGLPVSVKDCICVKEVESTAGSAILKGYKPVFDATVIEKVKKEGAIIIGKTAQDEFGFGTFSVNVGPGMKIPLNPIDKNRSCGGSSGGSGGITAKADFPHMSIAESTGGSIEAPASFCGVIGFCPTYGRVSRYGLMDYANSLDKIGPMSKSVEESALLLSTIAGYDHKDSTSINLPAEDYTKLEPKKNIRIGVISGSLGDGVDENISKSVWNTIKSLESNGIKYKEIKLPLTMKYVIPTYYMIAVSEASTNLAKYCGMRYGMHEDLEGNFNQYFSKVREKYFGAESKRRIMLGTFARMSGFRDAYYIKAAKVRTLIIQEYKQAFKDVDAIVSPTMPILAPKFDDISKMTPLQNYMADIMTAGPNLTGMPHISMPVGSVKGLPVGMLMTSDHLEESKLLNIAKFIEGKNA